MGQARIHHATSDRAEENGPEMIEHLKRPQAYPESTTQVDLVETHISWVFLTDRYAYKLKKPVRFEFLDFSTRELRRTACENEVKLNRRLARDVYLGVVPITRTASGRLQVGGSGVSLDWVVKMRRLPADCALDRRIRDQSLTETEINQVAETLANFYRQLPPVTTQTELYRRHLEQHVQSNREELLDPLHGFPASRVKRIHAAQLRVLRLNSNLFDDRVCDGRIVDGHGDLRPEHIYLNPAPTIIDCIEFNAELRELDVLDELSFFAMECAALNAASIGETVLRHYCAASKDRPPPELLSFYRSYRAAVRAKVNALRAQQLPRGQRSATTSLAEDYLRLADRYAAELGPPLLLIVRGLSGTGKSTLASALADSLGVELLQTDAVRHELFGASSHPAGYGEGHYEPKNRSRVYEAMAARTGALLAEGLSVVLDSTFLTTASRSQASALARRHRATPIVIHCVCPDRVAAARVESRRSEGGSLSEARPEFVRRQREQEEHDPPGLHACKIDTTSSIPVMLDRIYRHLQGALSSGETSGPRCA